MEQRRNPKRIAVEELRLDELGEGTPGITAEWGGYLAQAAAVCLEEQYHRCGVEMQMDGDYERTFSISWGPVTDQIRRCLGDEEEATENGAYAIAALSITRITDLVVVHRSAKGGGFDFWLGSVEDSDTLFQGKARLEVSGIRKGTEATIRKRVREKVDQTRTSDGSSEAYINVVEFGAPRSRMVRRCKT